MKMKPKEFFAYVAPSFLVMVLLMITPLFYTLYLSFHRFAFGGKADFVGFQNFLNVLSASRFWTSTYFTLLLVLSAGLLGISLGFIVALLLYEAKKLNGFFIGGFLLPYTVPPVVTTLIFGWLFRSHWGYVSYLLGQIGININWFADKWPARVLITMHTSWWVMPFVILIFYAGLQGIPEQLFEAARVDGANYFQRVIHVIIPYLKPLFIFVSMILVMDIYRIYDNVAVMTKGGPGTATETLSLYNYEVAFSQNSLGEASAISVLILFFMFFLLMPFLYQTYQEQRNI